MLSIAAYAKKLNLSFVFQPILELEVQHGDGFKDEDDVSNFIHRLNHLLVNLFNTNDSALGTLPKESRIVSVNPTIFNLLIVVRILILLNKVFNLDLIIRIPDAYSFTRLFPNSYSEVVKFCFESENPKKDTLNVQLHIRHSTLSSKSNRYLPPEFFLGWLAYIHRIATDRKLFVKLVIHTDCEFTGYDQGLINRHLTSGTKSYWADIGITDQNGLLNYSTISVYKDLVSRIGLIFPGYSISSGLDPLAAWSKMANADVILTSRSSFSFVGALLSKAGVIISPEMEMKVPKDWIIGHHTIPQNLDKFDRLLLKSRSSF
jgi:hypothetical protein